MREWARNLGEEFSGLLKLNVHRKHKIGAVQLEQGVKKDSRRDSRSNWGEGL